MTVHMVRILAEQPDGVTEAEAREAVQGWYEKHGPVLQNEEMDLTRTRVLNPETPWHFRADFRFELNSQKNLILDRIENVLQKYVGWYKIGYHGCPHDEADPPSCSWNATLEFGPVPEGVNL